MICSGFRREDAESLSLSQQKRYSESLLRHQSANRFERFIDMVKAFQSTINKEGGEEAKKHMEALKELADPKPVQTRQKRKAGMRGFLDMMRAAGARKG